MPRATYRSYKAILCSARTSTASIHRLPFEFAATDDTDAGRKLKHQYGRYRHGDLYHWIEMFCETTRGSANRSIAIPEDIQQHPVPTTDPDDAPPPAA